MLHYDDILSLSYCYLLTRSFAIQLTPDSQGRRVELPGLQFPWSLRSQGFQPVHLPPINVGTLSRAATAPGNFCDLGTAKTEGFPED